VAADIEQHHAGEYKQQIEELGPQVALAEEQGAAGERYYYL